MGAIECRSHAGGTFEYLMDKYGPTMTPSNAGEVLHSCPSHVRSLCESGELPAVKIGKRWHISTVKLAEMLEGGAW